MSRRLIGRAALLGCVLALVGAGSAQANSARHSYETIWRQDARFYAPDMPSPLVRFNQPTPGAWALTYLGADQPRFVAVGRAITGKLAQPTASHLRTDHWVLDWEWARVLGPTDQGEYWPMSIANAMLRFHKGRASAGATRRILQRLLPHWGANPRGIFDPAPTTPPPPAPTPVAPDPYVPPTPCPTGTFWTLNPEPHCEPNV